jgi:aldehyde dehydrogenase (NAD+)
VNVISPATEAVVGWVPQVAAEDVDRAVAAAARSWESGVWRDTCVDERGAVMTRLAESLDARKGELARMVTLQVGSPITMSLGSQTAAFGLVRAFVDAVRTMTLEEIRTGPRGKAIVRHMLSGLPPTSRLGTVLCTWT